MYRICLIILVAFSLSFIFLSISADAKSFQEAFTIPSTEVPNTIQINDHFKDGDEYILNTGRVTSLSIDLDVFLTKKNSYARVVLVDYFGHEWLVHQAGFPFENLLKLEDVCEETCLLEPSVIPKKLLIEVSDDNTQIYIKKINYLLAGRSVSLDVTKTSIKDIQKEVKIDAFNQKEITWIAGETPISDLSYTEKKAKLGGWFGTTCGFEFYTDGVFRFCEEVGDGPYLDGRAEAVVFDWRNRHGQNWNSPVKNQGGCGSCWAFSALGSTEGVFNTYYNQHLDLDLSEQDFVSCAPTGDCSGGGVSSSLNYMRSVGVVNESCFPYIANDGNCDDRCTNPQFWKINYSSDVDNVDNLNREFIIKQQLMKNGPLAMTGPMYYWSHAITLSGYGYDDNGLYWIFKNSWGTGYQDNGYGKIAISPYYLDHDTNFYYISVPYPPPEYTYNKLCFDNDLDGYCTWGTEDRPNICSPDIGLDEIGYDCCSSLCQPEPDCDDSNNLITTCSNDTLFCGEFQLAFGGERSTFGSYHYGTEFACCGDDPDEFINNSFCCSDPSKMYVQGECRYNPIIILYSGTTYPPTEEVEELIVDLNEVAYFEAVTTTHGNLEGDCDECKYDWIIDNVSQFVDDTKFSTTFFQGGPSMVTVDVVDNRTRKNNRSVYILAGLRELTSDQNNQQYPRIYGNTIVWRDFSSGDYEVFMYDIITEQATQITNDSLNQQNLAIYEDIIVWTTSSESNLYLYNITIQNTTQLTNNKESDSSPDINGDMIVFARRNGTISDLFIYNLTEGKEIRLTEDNFSQSNPKIDGHRIVWTDSRTGDLNIYSYDTITGVEKAITSNSNSKGYPDIHRDVVVWHEYGANSLEIVSYNFSNGQTKQLTLDDYNQFAPSIYENKVYWSDMRYDNYDVYEYDLTTQEERRLTINKTNQMNPQVYENYVVWEDRRNGDYDIYMLELTKEQSSSDVNNDGVTNVIDIILVTFWQGKSDADSDWTDYIHLDIIQDAMINFLDVIAAKAPV